jgi:hypothetical protein
MLTQEQRRQLEAEWSSDERAIASYARLLKAAVLSLMLLGLVWIGATAEPLDNVEQSAAVDTAKPVRQAASQ